MTANVEHEAFVRWLRAEHPGVSTARHFPPAQDHYIEPAVQGAWQGWLARARVLGQWQGAATPNEKASPTLSGAGLR